MAVLRLRTLVTTAALAIACLTATAHGADASLFLVFDRTSGAPGTVVHVRTGGTAGCTECPDLLPLYFAEVTATDRIVSFEDPALTRAGALTVDTKGNGQGTITVPDVPNGRYDVLAYCRPCAATSGGRSILPVGPFPGSFRVVGSAASSPTSVSLWTLVGLATALLAGIAFGFQRLMARRRTTESQESPP